MTKGRQQPTRILTGELAAQDQRGGGPYTVRSWRGSRSVVDGSLTPLGHDRGSPARPPRQGRGASLRDRPSAGPGPGVRSGRVGTYRVEGAEWVIIADRRAAAGGVAWLRREEARHVGVAQRAPGRRRVAGTRP